jgi:hypothetical protein
MERSLKQIKVILKECTCEVISEDTIISSIEDVEFMLLCIDRGD